VTLPDDTINKVNDIAKHVGSPNYIRTPSFQKAPHSHENSSSASKRKRDKNEAHALWSKMKPFQPTKMDEKTGIDADINEIRCSLNKLTDKNTCEITDKIIDIIDKLVALPDEEDKPTSVQNIERVGNAIFDIASTNRFFSRVYAEVYAALYSKYEVMQTLLNNNYDSFLQQFSTIEYASPEIDYNEFCRVNKINERRRTLSAFYLNLYFSSVLTFDKIEYLVEYMLKKILALITEEDKIAEVDEYSENVSILFDKDAEYDESIKINNMTIKETVEMLAKTKIKSYPSLSSKCVFKYMDMCGM
jgi:hypothetical protein